MMDVLKNGSDSELTAGHLKDVVLTQTNYKRHIKNRTTRLYKSMIVHTEDVGLPVRRKNTPSTKSMPFGEFHLLHRKLYIVKAPQDGCNTITSAPRCTTHQSTITISDMPPGTDCPYPIRIFAVFAMIRPYHVVIRI